MIEGRRGLRRFDFIDFPDLEETVGILKFPYYG